MASVFPVGLILKGKRCVVVGDGAEAAQRAAALTEMGAEVLLTHGADFVERDLDGAWLAVLVNRDAELAGRVSRAAGERRVFFCAIDQPEFSSFSHLAIARAGDVLVAISTSGKAPALASRLRQELERVFEAAGLAAFAGKLSALRERLPPGERLARLSRAVEHVRFGALELPRDADPDHSKTGAPGGPGMGSGTG
jgi:siroheme synthase (precorrin-2 oxidase/ferrochelatase)